MFGKTSQTSRADARTEAAGEPGPPCRRPFPRGRRAAPASLAGLAIAAIAAWVGLGIGGPRAGLYVDDLATVLAALLAAVTCARAAVRYGDTTRRFWFRLAAACSAWTAAEIVWAVDELVLGEAAPFPSWADLGYLAAVPLAGLALLSHPVMRDRAGAGARALIDGLTVAAALVFCSWTFVLGPVWRDGELGALARAVAVAYPCGDVVIVFLVLHVLQRIEGASRSPLRWVLAGMTGMALADSGYAYLTTVGKYETGNLMDVGWVAAYLALAVGASQARRPGVDGVRPPVPCGSPVLDTPPLTPFLPMFVALFVVAVEANLGRRLDAVSWASALVLVLSVFARLAPPASRPRVAARRAGPRPAGRP